MRKTGIIVVFIFSLLVASYAVIQYGFYNPKLAGLVQFKLKSPNFHLTPWVYFLYAHIITACLALVIGPFQLFGKKTGKKKQLHRQFGKIYVGSVFISGLVNIYLSIFASGGWISSFGFFFLDLLWLLTTGMAVKQIVNGKIQQHKFWMWRSYALTFAGVMLRIYLAPLLILLFHGEFGMANHILAWICWVPNILLIELFIRVVYAKKQDATVKTIVS